MESDLQMMRFHSRYWCSQCDAPVERLVLPRRDIEGNNGVFVKCHGRSEYVDLSIPLPEGNRRLCFTFEVQPGDIARDDEDAGTGF